MPSVNWRLYLLCEKEEGDILTFALAGGLKRKKTWWVHPINQKRNKLGTFHTLVSELRLNEILEIDLLP
jgi:hypothetical protein